MLKNKIPNEKPSVLFSHFLNAKAFLLIYCAGIAIIISGFNLPGAIEAWNIPGLFYFALSGPVVYLSIRSIYGEFTSVFEMTHGKISSLQSQTEFPQSEVAYLFSKKDEFETFIKEVYRLLNNRKERYFSIGLAFGIIIPLSFLSALLDGSLQRMLFGPLNYFEAPRNLINIIYWSIIAAVFLSIVWMITTALIALFRLNRTRQKLHITQSLAEIHNSFVSSNSVFSQDEIDMLAVSFRRFKAGLSPLANFILSSSLKFALAAVFFSIPAIVSLLDLGYVWWLWLAICIVWIGMSVCFFVVGQYYVWDLEFTTKKNAMKLLNFVCVKKTDKNFNSNVEYSSKKQTNDSLAEIDVRSVNDLAQNIASLSSVAYSSSSFLKVFFANLVAFLPVSIEILIRLLGR